MFWHTQGSGKSLSMVFYAQLLQDALDSPTIVVMTDRIDLDDQLYAQFSQCADFLRQTPVQAESKEHLKSLLDGRSANGIIFTTMFKFERGEKALSERRNIVVMADEAHRGQYGFDEKIVMSENENGEREAHTVIGNARIIHDALPNATFIGFTGTPISAKDRNTREVFGDYIDVYDMTQAVEDGATRPVYYESRVVHLKLDENTLALIDSTYDILEQQSDAQTIEKSKKMLGQMESVLGADSTIESLCDDIVEHYEKYRANLLTGKAMIVAYSRPIAMKIYRQILKIRPAWIDKVGVVMTGGNNDPEDWKEIIGTKSHKEELARKFKDNNDPMKIAIVVDMWLTGFDVPSLATMYVYKPMHGYNLMQAIARVNRVFKDKEGGLIVDYVGIASALKAAMKEYTKRDQSKYGDMNIAKMAYPKFQEKLQVCKDLLYGFDFSEFVGGSPLTRAKLITGGVNFILDASVQERKDLFLKEAMLLKQSHSLCISYVLRRAICEIPTNSMNKTFATLKNYIRPDDYLNSIKAFFVMQDTYKEFPDDDKFEGAFVSRDIYNMRARNYILSRLENFENKAPIIIENYTIEHIMPQNKNLSLEWQADLGTEWQEVQKKYLHTIGNLTLTAYNSEMSDRPFLEKMDMLGGFKESALRLNKYVVLQNKWNEKHIQERANELAKKAESIWPYPTLTVAELAPYQVEDKTVQKYSLETYDVNAFTRILFESLDKRIMNLSPAVKKEYKKLYVAYKLDTNFVDIVFQKQRLRISINMKFSEINDPNGICKDITGLGRWGNGDVELFMEHQDELEQIMEIVKQSFDAQAE